MFPICLFCNAVFSPKDVKSQGDIEGHMHKKIECQNCGAGYKMTIFILNGPTKPHHKNEPSKKPA